MKKLFAIMLVAGSMIMTANAQDSTKRSHKHHDKEAAMAKLNLTADQKAKMKADKDAYKQQVAALDKNDKDYKEKKKALHKAQKEKTKAMLTPDQKKQFDQMKKDKKKNHKSKPGKGKPAAAPTTR